MSDTAIVAVVIAVAAVVAIILWFAMIRRGRGVSDAAAPARMAAAPEAPAEAATTGKLEVRAVHHGVSDEQEGEWVQIVNMGQHAVQLAGWRLTDEGEKHSYTFPSLVLASEAAVRVHMWVGDDDHNDLYVGRRQRWWNNDGDTAYLYDATGTLVHKHSYGTAAATE